MATLFALCLTLLSGSEEPPLFVPPFSKIIPPSEEFHREHLAMSRRGRIILEETIKLFEEILKNHPDVFSPKEASDLRQDLNEWREQVEKMKKVERELERWEQERKRNPGRETDLKALERLEKLHRELWEVPTAPMPRAVK